MPVIDKQCDSCNHTEMDEYEPKAGLPDYGVCPKCNAGLMKQMLCAPNFNMHNGLSGLDGKAGRTKDGTKWEIVGRPRKYDARTKTWGSEVG